MVGFDLGAHIVGMVGRSLDQKVARITGLSPARQGWDSRSGRLNNGDARYVEVIHTDSNGALGHGVNEAIGQVDFFVNGGSRQPGCFLNNRCNHEYAWKIFALSIVQNIFGNHCRNRHQVTLNTCRRGDILIMGNIQLNKRGSGLYRVNT
ncbi:lipase member I-like [Melitaea cinxia]|uniref:lipase member I-like n=1 Tax=Melitaea cinxia TaxID=113334 RepID=UPI001E272C8F|nr:lipase member I-like [Melitaea cinxia]